MKAFRVAIPILVAEAHDGDPVFSVADLEHQAMTLSFRIEARDEQDAATIMYERLETLCGDP